MRKWITLVMTLLVGASASYVNASCDSEVSFEAGYRRDNISWKHRFSNRIESRQRFENLDIFQIGLNAKTFVGGNFYARGSASVGWILDGNFKDTGKANFFVIGNSEASDFDAIGATAEHRTIVDDRYVYDLSAAIGYPFFFCGCNVAVAPVVGYAFDEQNLKVQGGRVEFIEDSEGVFPITTSDCCARRFINRWYGPFIGVDFDYRPCGECWNLYGQFEYHWAYFRGRTGEASNDGFGEPNHHSHHGHGWVVDFGAEYVTSCNWVVGLDFKWQDFSASRHKRRDESSSSSDSSSSGFSLGHRENFSNDWRSFAVSLTFGRDF